MKIINKSSYLVPERLEEYFDQVYSLFLERLGLDKELEVEVGLLDTEEIKDLNKEYRNKDEATDVLSFPLEPLKGEKLLGAIYFCYPIVDKKYEDIVFGFCYLFAHSLLHLIGYDHGSEMFSIQEEIVYSVFKE